MLESIHIYPDPTLCIRPHPRTGRNRAAAKLKREGQPRPGKFHAFSCLNSQTPRFARMMVASRLKSCRKGVPVRHNHIGLLPTSFQSHQSRSVSLPTPRSNAAAILFENSWYLFRTIIARRSRSPGHKINSPSRGIPGQYCHDIPTCHDDRSLLQRKDRPHQCLTSSWHRWSSVQ